MKKKHKNGDWYISDDGYWTATISVYDDRLQDGVIRQEREQCIAYIPNRVGDGSVRIGKLICAAPDLLEALRKIADIADGSTTANSLQHLSKIARAAIAKANGGAA